VRIFCNRNVFIDPLPRNGLYNTVVCSPISKSLHSNGCTCYSMLSCFNRSLTLGVISPRKDFVGVRRSVASTYRRGDVYSINIWFEYRMSYRISSSRLSQSLQTNLRTLSVKRSRQFPSKSLPMTYIKFKKIIKRMSPLTYEEAIRLISIRKAWTF
jgi:hypothetical protein